MRCDMEFWKEVRRQVLAVWLESVGRVVNRKRVQRLMRLMGIEALTPHQPGTNWGLTPDQPGTCKTHFTG